MLLFFFSKRDPNLLFLQAEIARRRQQIEENARLHDELYKLARLRESTDLGENRSETRTIVDTYRIFASESTTSQQRLRLASLEFYFGDSPIIGLSPKMAHKKTGHESLWELCRLSQSAGYHCF